MEIFISWSGTMSRGAAEALRDFLIEIFGARVRPWFSSVDIAKGRQWSRELFAALERANFGIICVTQGNRSSPWLLFEAGAIAKAVDHARVCPFLIDLTPNQLSGPLAQFQVTQSHKGEARLLVHQINAGLSKPIQQPRLRGLMELGWRKLAQRLRGIRRRSSSAQTHDEIRAQLIQFLRTMNSYEDLATLLQPSPFERLTKPRKALRLELTAIPKKKLAPSRGQSGGRKKPSRA